MSSELAEIDRLLEELRRLGQVEGELIRERRLVELPALTARRAALAAEVATAFAGATLEEGARERIEREIEAIRRETGDHLALLSSSRDELADEIGDLAGVRRALDRYATARRS